MSAANWELQGPLMADQQAVLDLRWSYGHTLDTTRSFLEMPTGMPRPRHKGAPIPYTVQLDGWTGRPEWKQNDGPRRAHCVLDRRCGLCGEHLGETAFVMAGSGDVSPALSVVDRVALHPDPCAAVTLARCPGLAAAAASGGIVRWVVPTASLVVGGPPDGPAFMQPASTPEAAS